MPRQAPNDNPEMYFTSIALEAEADIYNTDTVYLITFSINPKRYHSRDPREQYSQLLTNIIHPMCKQCFKTFAITPELNENNNIHIHGWFVLKDSIKWHRKWFPKLKFLAPNGTRINKMRNKSALNEYYKKDIEKMNIIINGDIDDNELPIPLTHINISAYYVTYLRRVIREYMDTKELKKHHKDITQYLLSLD